jgi:hypothetical protein
MLPPNFNLLDQESRTFASSANGNMRPNVAIEWLTLQLRIRVVKL